MNTKHPLSVILIFTAIFLYCFSVQAQSSSDTIRLEKKGLGYIYYKGNTVLNFKQVMYLSSDNGRAYYILEKSRDMRNASYFFGIVGGGCLGFSLGYALAGAILANPIKMPLFISLMGSGVLFIGIGFAFEIGANNKAKEGIAVYNLSIKQKDNTSFNFGISTNGVMLRLNF
jgi:hypothetical protein